MTQKLLILLMYSILFSTIFSCQTNSKRRDLNQYYVGAGVADYFLADLPKWANYSQAGHCQRNKNIRYLNYKKLRSSFAFSYEEVVQLQYTLNKLFVDFMKKNNSTFLPLRDEERLFHESVERVNAGIKLLSIPNFKAVNLIWADGIKSDKSLKKILRSEITNSRPTYLISLCNAYNEMEKYIKSLGSVGQGINFISYEAFNPYSTQRDFFAGHLLEFDKLFSQIKKKYLYLPKSWNKRYPQEFQGQFERVISY